MSERVLVTGGAGFIGSHLVDRLLTAGYAVRVLDNLHPQVHPSGTWPEYLDPAAERVLGDVRDAGAVGPALAGVDVVLHHAARVGVGQSQYEIADYLDVNVRGTGTLLEALIGRRSHVRKLVVASSMSTYGEGRYRCAACARDVHGLQRDEARLARGDWDPVCPGCGGPLAAVPTDESTPLSCASVYALSKRLQEELVLLFGRTYGVPAVALRYFNTYGPRQALANPYTGVAAIFLSRLKAGQPPVAYEDGRQQRDFVSVHDVAAANLAAITRPDADGLAVNVGSGRQVTVLEIAAIAARHLGSAIAAAVTGRWRKGDVRHCFADVRRLATALGHTPRVSFEQGFAELAAWAATAAAADYFPAAQRALSDRGLF